MVEVVSHEDDVWIFSFGSNHPRQLCERMSLDFDDLMGRSRAATLHNYVRAYGGSGPRWDHKSVATIAPKEGCKVTGLACRFTTEELTRLDPFEGYPEWYNREKIKLETIKEAGKMEVI